MIPGICSVGTAANSIKASGLSERICPHWRMAAGLVCLAASIMAIGCAIIWNTQWLCIPFGLSALSSAYVIYLGYQFSHLKSMETQIQGFKTSNKEHKTLIEELKQTLNGFTNLLNQHEGEFQGLKNSTDSIKTDLKKIVTCVQTLKDSFDPNVINNHIETLTKLNQNIFESNANLTHLLNEYTERKTTLKELGNSVEDLKQIKESIKSEVDRLTKQLNELKKQIDRLVPQNDKTN